MNRTMLRGALLLVLMLLLILETTACGGSTSDVATVDQAHEKEVRLVGYLIGEAPKGMPQVLQAINEKLKKDINATIELNYIGWGDAASKYPLVLASGQDVDFIFAAEWIYYVSEATRGSLYPLSRELLEKYMPRHMKAMPPEALEAAKVNGTPYMIPTSSPDTMVNVALFRKDVMDKAGMKEIRKFSDIEPYLAEIKKSYPGMTPLNLDSRYDLPVPFSYLLSEKFAWSSAPIDSGDPLAEGIAVDMEDKAGKMYSMVEEPILSYQKEAARIMKDWYDKGYVNRNPYANNIRSKDNFCNGKSGIAFGNSIDTQNVFMTCKEQGIDIYPLPLLYPSGKASKVSLLNNGAAIASSSKNPERAMEALDLLMDDPSYAYLAYYGIEGVNYAFTPDGRIGLPEGVTSETNTYPPDAAGFWFVNKSLFKPMANWTDSYTALQEQIRPLVEAVPYRNFFFNSAEVKSEVANMKSVSTQYAQSLYIGAVDDVDAAFDTLVGHLKKAGIDKVKMEVQKQGDLYLASQNGK
ncbi:putative aldouronate transport system substrate-binding protein [Paenibacillus cellulosilyticus]|uniref:Putative aldouronate transport system substrate-binding protein n=1 Tax=Paenibacillus cellulosilyticus TaxID=375489 RepID=A0A2V2YT87_9BACL|nr:extracellular solute-binding protein [Paenibacillus cellulosilyticus]PWW02527.1 putative aldouronate transport system substrate-binding protein [Paenibacillus cellulosilyticus]QKS47224.1 extracellular solute-binding protein [Paenibacillus cellulosilyticus]